MPKPRIGPCPMFGLLRDGKIQEFNDRKAQGEPCDLRGTDLSRIDLREMDAEGLDLSDCYFRMSDLRGIDFRKTNLEGASIALANVSGCFFPAEITAEELQLALAHGTRIRYRR